MLDREIAARVALLTGRDQNAAYAALLALEKESAESDGVYRYFDQFAAMLTAKSGFVRMRGLRLAAANARWDEDCRVEAALPALLGCVTDPKPIVARCAVGCLPHLAAEKPSLAPVLRAALEGADFSSYGASMAPLLEGDRAAALDALG